MYMHEGGGLCVRSESIDESVGEEWKDLDGDKIDVFSRYLVTIEKPSEGLKYEVVIQLEGNPGAGPAAYQVFDQIRGFINYPLDSIARVNLRDLVALTHRLGHMCSLIAIGVNLGLDEMSMCIADMPEWDLSEGRYQLLEIHDESTHNE